MLQASSTAAAFFYSPYIPYPFLVLITGFFMSVGLVFLFVLDRWVKPIDSVELIEVKEKQINA